MNMPIRRIGIPNSDLRPTNRNPHRNPHLNSQRTSHPAGFSETVMADSFFDAEPTDDAEPRVGTDFADTLVLQDLPEASFMQPAPRRIRNRSQEGVFRRHLSRHGAAYLWGVPVLVIWALAYVRVFVDPIPRVPLVFNWTSSLPYRVGLLRKDMPGAARLLQRGDQVVYAFDGEAQTMYPGLQGQPFYKVVRGLPGDRIALQGRTVTVNGTPVGTAKTHTFDKRPLSPIEPMVIPPGHYYVQGSSPDSFDSRYRASGLVKAEQLLGRVTPLF
jgi:conjugal transfer pilin signal peptidase TrbI